MRKVMLAVVVVVLSTTAALAQSQQPYRNPAHFQLVVANVCTVELPDEEDGLTGAWCTVSAEKPEPGERTYGKHVNEEYEEDDECGKGGGIFIWDTGYRYFSRKGDVAICEFTAIQFSRHEGDPGEDDYNVYEVHAKCRSVEDGNIFSEHFEIASSEGTLIQQFLPES